MNRWLLPRMDAVHVVSDLEREQVHRVYAAPLERTVMIPPGVDIPLSHTEPRDARLCDNPGCGTLERAQGPVAACQDGALVGHAGA